MGCKLNSCMSPLHAGISDGNLIIYIGDKEYKIPVKSLGKLHIGRQCNAYSNDEIMVVLHGEARSVVLRYDGTGTLYTGDNVFVRALSFNPKLTEGIVRCVGGCGSYDTASREHAMFTLYDVVGTELCLISSQAEPLMLTVAKDEQFMNYCERSREAGLPIVTVNEDAMQVEMRIPNGTFYTLSIKEIWRKYASPVLL